MTVLHHAWWGVDLFFVVSGFSLAQGYLGERARWPSRGAFWRRRALRILPGYYAALVVVVATRAGELGAPGVWGSLAAHAALLQGLVAPGGHVWIGASWSLTTEVCFYVLLPLLAAPLFDTGASRRSILWVVGLVALAWAARAVSHELLLTPTGPSPLFEASQRRWITSRLDEFMLGVGAALAERSILNSSLRARFERAAPLALLGSVALVVVAFRLEGALYLEPLGFWPAYLLSLATALSVLSAVLVRGPFERVLAPAWLRRVGVVSYGVFLYHQLALRFVGDRVSVDASWLGLARYSGLALVLSIIAGELSWRALESRFLKRR